MEVVDAVKVHVLGVPSEGCLPAAEVKVGGVHAVNLDTVVLQQHEAINLSIYQSINLT